MMVRNWLPVVIGLGAGVALFGASARPAFAESVPVPPGPAGTAAPLWIAPAEPAGGAPPAGEAHAGCGPVVIWSDGPAGAGTWSARPAAGGGLPVVLGTWRRAAAGLSPLVDIGTLPAGRYQLTVEGTVAGGRALLVDCRSAAAPAPAVRVVSAPPAIPSPAPVTDADGNTVPPVSDERLAASEQPPGLPGAPAGGLTGLLVAGLALAGGLIVGARRIA